MRQFFVVGGVSLWCRAFLSRGGGFLSNARNSAGAGRNKHTPLASKVVSNSFFWIVFAGSGIVSSPRTQLNLADFPRPSCTTRPRGKQSGNSHAVPTYLKKRDPRGRTNEMGSLKALARPIETAHRWPQCDSAIRARKCWFRADLTSEWH